MSAERPIEQAKSRSIAPSVLFPFRTRNLDRYTVSKELRTKILSPLPDSEVQDDGLGYVYILRSKLDISTQSVLKIGFSKHHPEHRAHNLASCLAVPEIVAHTPRIPHAKRIESLIHTELVANRKVKKCRNCGADHQEWFAISHAESREIVIRWSRWVLRRPYIDGKLSEKWRTYLQKQDFVSTNPQATMPELWRNILDGFPLQNTDPEEQPAAYLTACYWKDIFGRIVGLSNGSISRMEMIKYLSTGAFSVSNLEQDRTEFPLGEATLLPVLSLKDLRCMEAPKRKWVGYSPAYEWFQMLHEAYQRGEWVGNVSQSFCKACNTHLRTQAAAAIGTKGTDTPTGSTKRGQVREDVKARDSEIEPLSGPDGQKVTVSSEIDDGYTKQVKEVQETKEFLDRTLVESELIRQFRYPGINADSSYEEISSSEDSEGNLSDDDADKMDIDEPEPEHHKASSYEAISISEDSEDNLSDDGDDKMDIDESEPRHNKLNTQSLAASSVFQRPRRNDGWNRSDVTGSFSYPSTSR
ncbi:hypothetical protein VTI74DRAFT_6242 [Chaetomium olivicolor]